MAVADERRLQLGLRPVALHRARGQLRDQPRRQRPRRRVPRDGPGAQRHRPARGDGRRLQPHQRGRPERQVGARPDRARLLPPPQRQRQRRALDLLREHRHRARHDGEAHGRLGGHLGEAVQGRRLPLRPHGPPPEGEHARRSRTRSTRSRSPRTAWTASRSTSTARAGTSARWPTTRGEQATQVNMAGTGIGTFNDRLRDGVARRRPVRRSSQCRASSPASSTTRTALPGQPTRAADAPRAHRLDQGRPRRQPRGLSASSTASGQPRARPSGRLQRPARRLHRRSAGGHQLRRRARQRDAVRRHPAQGARRDDAWPTACACRTSGCRSSLSARASRSSTPATSCCARSRSTATATTRATGSTGSTSPTQSNNWGVGLPPARGNQSNWPVMKPLLANPALRPTRPTFAARCDTSASAADPQELPPVPPAHGGPGRCAAVVRERRPESDSGADRDAALGSRRA